MESEKHFFKDLMWTSCRYCIGRHTYVTMLAKDIGEYFYDKLTNDEKEHQAYDIRRQISDCLQFQPFNFCVQFDYSKKETKPLELFFEFVNSQDTSSKDWLSKVSHVDAYKGKDGVIFDVSYYENIPYTTTVWEHEIQDLIPWMNLASLFDVKNHKMVTCDDGKGNRMEVECYESYINESTEEKREGQIVYLTPTPWKYKKVYRPVDKGVSDTYIEPNTIKGIKDLKL
jgi:hypothetical protein